MNLSRSYSHRWVPNPSFLTCALVLIQGIFLIEFYYAGNILPLENKVGFILSVPLTFCSLLILGFLVDMGTPTGPFSSALVSIAVILLYSLASFYHLRSTTAFDVSVLCLGTRYLAYPETYTVILDAFQFTDWLLLGTMCLGMIFLATRTSVFAQRTEQHRLQKLSYLLPLYLGLTFLPITNWDECNNFLKSARQTLFQSSAGKKLANLPTGSEKFPYVKFNPDDFRHVVSAARRPHIFLILVESFSQSFAEARTADGREYTPFFNSLIPQGLYVEHFYGNSVYTLMGQVATLCSIMPIPHGDIAYDHPRLNLLPLPKILKDQGYQTLFLQGQVHVRFNDTDMLMKHLGFEEVKGMDSEFVSDSEKRFVWGWGLQDDLFYRKTFEYLDRHQERENELHPNETPKYFVTLMPISNHSPFNQMPKSERFLFSNPQTRREQYSNSIRAMDQYLASFFNELSKRKYLENSLIFILGDHSFPNGEHGHSSSETKYYEENFRTPFLMLGSRAYRGKRLRSPSFSQLDVAPTILDMLDLSVTNHFLGRSIVDPRNRQETYQYLVQPFDGRYLGVVRYPYKYFFRERTGDEFLHNLERDPTERTNLISQPDMDTILPQLRQALKAIYLNEKLVKENRIWPIARPTSELLKNIGDAEKEPNRK